MCSAHSCTIIYGVYIHYDVGYTRISSALHFYIRICANTLPAFRKCTNKRNIFIDRGRVLNTTYIIHITLCRNRLTYVYT